MPCRLVDGDAWARSRKLKDGVDERYRVHYLAWLTLAEANGTFECDLEAIHARLYAFQLSTIKIRHVREMFEQFVRAGVLDTWQTGEGTAKKSWGFFPGSEKPGRLVSKEHLKRYKNLPPDYPGSIREASGIAPEGFGVDLEGKGVGLSCNIENNTNASLEKSETISEENTMAENSAKRFTEDCLTIWQEVHGRSGGLIRPESQRSRTDKKDWLFLVQRYDGDLLRKAFRLFSEEYSNGSDQWALCKFINKAVQYMQIVEPLKAPTVSGAAPEVLAAREAAGKRDNEEQQALNRSALEGKKPHRSSDEGANPDDFFTEE